MVKKGKDGISVFYYEYVLSSHAEATNQDFRLRDLLDMG
jgi:hypothetical protein